MAHLTGIDHAFIDEVMMAKLSLLYILFAFLPHMPAHAEPVISSYEPEDTQNWTTAGFKNPDIKRVRMTSISDEPVEIFTHTLEPTLVIFRNSGWSERKVAVAIERVAEIYKQCGIKIEFAKMITVDPPFGHRSAVIDKPYEGLDLKIASQVPTLTPPVMYFVKEALNGYTAWAAPRYFVAPGYAKQYPDLKAMEDSAWITSTILKEKYWTPWKDPSYSVEAHELAHVIGNRHHVADDLKNILGGTQGTGNDQITPGQCEAFRNFDLVKKIEQ